MTPITSPRSSGPSRRALLSAAAATGGAGLLAACGSGSSDDSGSSDAAESVPTFDDSADTTITFMHAMSAGPQTDALGAIVDAFQKQYSNVKVELQGQPDYATLQTKTKAQVSAQSAPTIAQAYESWAAEYADSKVIVPLDGYAEADTASGLGDFYKGVAADLKLPDGTMWMWPFNKSVVVVYRNNSLVPEAPTTWDEFATVAKEVSTSDVVALSIDPGSSKGPAGGTALFEIIAESMGDAVYKADGTPQFDADGCVQALEYLVDLKQAGALATGTDYPGQVALGAQKGAFDISSVASYPFNEQAVGGKFEMGVSAVPAGPATTANQLAGTNVVLFASATDQEKAAAWKFLTFLTSPEQQAGWADATGYLPVSAKALEAEPLKSSIADSPWITDAAAQLDVATALPGAATVNDANSLLAVALQSVLQSDGDPQSALQDAQKKAAALG